MSRLRPPGGAPDSLGPKKRRDDILSRSEGRMKDSYLRYGRRFKIPSTAQILDELKTGFIPGYVPISTDRRPIREQPNTEAVQKLRRSNT
jgi:hypothetical protein